MNRTFAALADPTRRDMLDRLAGGDCSVTDLAAPLDMTLPAVMKHVRVLERAGLLTHEKSGRVRRCSLSAEPLRDAAAWIERYKAFWTDQLNALAAYLEGNQTPKPRRRKRRAKQSPRRKE